ncbi:MAG: DUF1801 domain-containing protein [Cyclobacteriaceae bacterium]
MPKNSRSFDEILFGLPRVEQELVKRLRTLIIECIPKATEHVYDDVDFPFYRHNKLICYIWPASMVWKNSPPETPNEKGTALGFNQGHLMSNEEGTLLAEGRKQVYVMYFKSLKDLDEQQVRARLFEAAMIDDQFANRLKGLIRKKLL